MTRHRWILIYVVVILFGAGVAGTGLQQKRPKQHVGIVDVMPAQSVFSVDELWQRSNVVAELVAMERMKGRELDEEAPEQEKRAVTPVKVRVQRIYKNATDMRLDVDSSLIVLEMYGRVETDAYIVETHGSQRFWTGRTHFAFLDCAADGTCRLRGDTVRIDGDQLQSDGIPKAVLDAGATRFREALAALQRREP
jgi:hypothetical protein